MAHHNPPVPPTPQTSAESKDPSLVLLNRKQVCKLLDISDRQLYRWLHLGYFPEAAIHQGKYIRWTKRQVINWFERRNREAERKAEEHDG